MGNLAKLLCFIIGTFIVVSVVDGRSVKLPFKRIRKDACPKGFYYNQDTRRCQKLPCGGTAIFSDNTKRCSKNYLGIKVHPLYNNFYYICEKHCVTFVKCPENQIFNSTINHCANPPTPPESVETEVTSEKSCGIEGSSNCSLFYICDSNGTKTVKKVKGGRDCFGQELNPDDYFEDYDMDTFPLCKRPGRFRSPTDCSLYYTCSAKTYGKFFQTRYRCPAGTLYDIEKERCRHKDRVKCEYVTVEDIIDEYHKTHNQTDVDSDESDYEDHWESFTITEYSSSTAGYTTDSAENITTEALSNSTGTIDSDTSTFTPTEPITSTTSSSSSGIKDDVDDYESSTQPSTNTESTTTEIIVTSWTNGSSTSSTETEVTYTTPSSSSEESTPVTEDDGQNSTTLSWSSEESTPVTEDDGQNSTTLSSSSEEFTPVTEDEGQNATTLSSSSEESTPVTEDEGQNATTLSSSSEESTPVTEDEGQNTTTSENIELESTTDASNLDSTTASTELISTTDGTVDVVESTITPPTTNAPCNGSSLNLEDQSIETLKVHVSKPLKLLINFAPKFSCKDCLKDKNGPQEEKRFKKEGKIVILNLKK